MEKFSNVNELVNILKPVDPVYCIRPIPLKDQLTSLKITFLEKCFTQLRQTPMKKY